MPAFGTPWAHYPVSFRRRGQRPVVLRGACPAAVATGRPRQPQCGAGPHRLQHRRACRSRRLAKGTCGPGRGPLTGRGHGERSGPGVPRPRQYPTRILVDSTVIGRQREPTCAAGTSGQAPRLLQQRRYTARHRHPRPLSCAAPGARTGPRPILPPRPRRPASSTRNGHRPRQTRPGRSSRRGMGPGHRRPCGAAGLRARAR